MDTSKPNAAGKFEKTDQKADVFVTINTIDNTAYVERLPNPQYSSRGANDILIYGGDNLYPNKVRSMAQRSQSTMSATETLKRFTAGQGFREQGGTDIGKIEINRYKQTLNDILDHAADEKSFFGVPLHFNYNVFGEITEIQEIPFETLRWKKDMSRLIFCKDWSRTSARYNKQDLIEYYPFDPEKAKEEIAVHEGGIDTYPGQVLYWVPKRKDIYPLAKFDRCLDDTQFEHESGVYKLRNIQNGYAADHIMFLPSSVETELEKDGEIKEIQKGKGSANSGKIKVVPMNASALEHLGSRKLIEQIPRTGIDKLFQTQNEETKYNIFSSLMQPPILSGITKDGMFNQESFLDAFDFYNSITEKDRQELERIFNSFLPYTIWGLSDVEIEPIAFMSKRGENQETADQEDTTEIKPEENGTDTEE